MDKKYAWLHAIVFGAAWKLVLLAVVMILASYTVPPKPPIPEVCTVIKCEVSPK